MSTTPVLHSPPPASGGSTPGGGVPGGPVPGGPVPGGGTRPPASGAPRVVAILAIVFGALVIVGAIGSAVVGTVVSASVQTTVRTVAVADATELAVDVSAGSLRIEYGAVREAELEVTGSWGADRWTLEQDGERLVVATPDRWGWFGWWLLWDGFDDRRSQAVLTLPSSVSGADADLNLSAGDLVVDGEFGELRLGLSAGSLTVTGSADAVVADVSAGRGEVRLDDVRRAALTVSAGGLDAELTGSAPDDVRAEVSAGSLRLTVPDAEYDVTSDVSAGDVDDRIGSTPGATRMIHVGVSAGELTLQSR